MYDKYNQRQHSANELTSRGNMFSVLFKREGNELYGYNMSRPVEYRDNIVERVKQYLILCEDEDNIKLPTIEGLSLFLDIARETVYDWEKKYKEFSDIIGRLRANQANELIQRGLSGKYNPTITKVLLTKHGYREGVDTTTNDKDLPTPLLNGIFNNNSNKEDSESK